MTTVTAAGWAAAWAGWVAWVGWGSKGRVNADERNHDHAKVQRHSEQNRPWRPRRRVAQAQARADTRGQPVRGEARGDGRRTGQVRRAQVAARRQRHAHAVASGEQGDQRPSKGLT